MRLTPFVAMLLAGACSPSPPPYRPPAPPLLNAQGLPPAYEACVQRKAAATPDMYDVFLDCREDLLFYVVQLPGLSLEEKGEIVERLERKAMNRAQEVVEARNSQSRRVAQATTQTTSAGSWQWAMGSEAQRWRDCLTTELRARDIMSGPVGLIAATVASQCRHLFSGEANQDVDIAANAVEKIRARDTGGAFVIDRQPMPPMDRRL